jgi:hypothetical protein
MHRDNVRKFTSKRLRVTVLDFAQKTRGRNKGLAGSDAAATGGRQMRPGSER